MMSAASTHSREKAQAVCTDHVRACAPIKTLPMECVYNFQAVLTNASQKPKGATNVGATNQQGQPSCGAKFEDPQRCVAAAVRHDRRGPQNRAKSGMHLSDRERFTGNASACAEKGRGTQATEGRGRRPSQVIFCNGFCQKHPSRLKKTFSFHASCTAPPTTAPRAILFFHVRRPLHTPSSTFHDVFEGANADLGTLVFQGRHLVPLLIKIHNTD